MSREKKLLWGSATGLIGRVVAIICSFITPRLILSSYGSEVNGLVNSISQFLAIINLLEAGISSVIDSNLYKPLAEKNFKI